MVAVTQPSECKAYVPIWMDPAPAGPAQKVVPTVDLDHATPASREVDRIRPRADDGEPRTDESGIDGRTRSCARAALEPAQLRDPECAEHVAQPVVERRERHSS